jgi:hypothetical protein
VTVLPIKLLAGVGELGFHVLDLSLLVLHNLLRSHTLGALLLAHHSMVVG